MNTYKKNRFQLTGFIALILFFSVATFSQEKTEHKKMNHKMHKEVKLDHSKMDSAHHKHMNHSMMDSTHHSMDSSHHSGMMKDTTSIVREKPVDLKAIDKNKDGKVFQDMMDWHVISDKAGECPLCGMTLKEVTLEKAKENLVKNGYKVKE